MGDKLPHVHSAIGVGQAGLGALVERDPHAGCGLRYHNELSECDEREKRGLAEHDEGKKVKDLSLPN